MITGLALPSIPARLSKRPVDTDAGEWRIDDRHDYVLMSGGLMNDANEIMNRARSLAGRPIMAYGHRIVRDYHEDRFYYLIEGKDDDYSSELESWENKDASAYYSFDKKKTSLWKSLIGSRLRRFGFYRFDIFVCTLLVVVLDSLIFDKSFIQIGNVISGVLVVGLFACFTYLSGRYYDLKESADSLTVMPVVDGCLVSVQNPYLHEEFIASILDGIYNSNGCSMLRIYSKSVKSLVIYVRNKNWCDGSGYTLDEVVPIIDGSAGSLSRTELVPDADDAPVSSFTLPLTLVMSTPIDSQHQALRFIHLNL